MLNIRKAKTEDALTLTNAEIQIAAVPGFLVPRPHEYQVSDIKSKIRNLSEASNGIYVVAESNEQILGHALLDPMGLESIQHIVRLSIVVHPGHQAKGVGTALLGHLIQWARQKKSSTHSEGKPVEKIELNVRATNERAIRLYESHGFQSEGRLLNRIKCPDGTYIDDIVMGLWI